MLALALTSELTHPGLLDVLGGTLANCLSHLTVTAPHPCHCWFLLLHILGGGAAFVGAVDR